MEDPSLKHLMKEQYRSSHNDLSFFFTSKMPEVFTLLQNKIWDICNNKINTLSIQCQIYIFLLSISGDWCDTSLSLLITVNEVWKHGNVIMHEEYLKAIKRYILYQFNINIWSKCKNHDISLQQQCSYVSNVTCMFNKVASFILLNLKVHNNQPYLLQLTLHKSISFS